MDPKGNMNRRSSYISHNNGETQKSLSVLHDIH